MKVNFLYLLFFLVSVVRAENALYCVVDKEIKAPVLQYDGIIVPGNAVEIFSPANVTVKSKNFHFGDRVQTGQLLFELSSPELIVKLTNAKMDVMEHSQALEKLKHWSSSPEMLRAQSSVNRSHQHHTHASNRYEQAKKLFNAGIISKEEYLSDQRFHEESFQNDINARQQLEEVKQKGGARYLKLAQMKLRQSKEEVEILSKKVQSLQMKSPLSGVILLPDQIKEGKDPWGLSQHQNTFQDRQVMAIIADIEQLYVLVKVDEFDVIQLKRGDAAQITILPFPNTHFQGKIQDINIQTSQVKENHHAARFEVRVLIENIPSYLKEKLLLGMSASIKYIPSIGRGLFIPKQAVIYDNEIPFVHVWLENEKRSVKQTIVLGERTTDFVEVKQGVSQGDKLVLHS